MRIRVVETKRRVYLIETVNSGIPHWIFRSKLEATIFMQEHQLHDTYELRKVQVLGLEIDK